ncbi:transposase [Desulfolutivibrio sulfodismutans]
MHVLRGPVRRTLPAASHKGPWPQIFMQKQAFQPGRFEFLTNHMTIPARTIADIDKGRRQVEIFFRFSKQNLNITPFLGNSKNAVLSHVYVALIAYLLLAYQKFQSKIGLRLHYLARLVRRNLFQQCERNDLVDLDRNNQRSMILGN